MNSALLSQINSGARLKKVPDSQKNDRSAAAAGAVVGKATATILCVGLFVFLCRWIKAEQ